MRFLISLGLVFLLAQQCVAPPVTKEKSESEDDKKHDDPDHESEDGTVAVEYHRYLREVLQVIESDPTFLAKLQNASEDAIKSGAIANELDFVHHGLRSQLDEIKRKELSRLRRSATRQYEMEQGLDPDHLKIHEHVDHENPETFEVVDLKKLILKTTADLGEVDRQRREEFQRYEMQKKFEEEEKKKKMNEEEKKKYENELKALEEKHKKHKPLHHPGSKQQYEEVWEKQDHMEDQKFDLRTFFQLHDIDGNGVWDPVEVNALFLKELDKIYAQGGPETDIRERVEEMERMREHVFSEADLDKDGLISLSEFIEQSKSSDFEKDEGWKTLDEQEIYTEQDYAKFERQQRDEIERRIANGISPPGYGSYDPGHNQQFAPQYAGVPHQEFMPPMGDRSHPANQQPHYQGQVPQYQGQVPQYQGQVPQYQNIPQYQGYQQQVPQYQGHPAQGQLPPQHYQQGQVPQHQGQIPQNAQIPQQHLAQGQMPQQASHQGQVPQQASHQGQVPQQASHQGQVPQQASHQGQVPQQASHQGQVPQQASHQGQVPQQASHQGQVPQQASHQGQVPQQASHQGQVPQQASHQGQVAQQGQVHQQGQAPQQGQPPQQAPHQVVNQGQPQQGQHQVPVQQNSHPSGNEIPDSPPEVASPGEASKPK